MKGGEEGVKLTPHPRKPTFKKPSFIRVNTKLMIKNNLKELSSELKEFKL